MTNSHSKPEHSITGKRKEPPPGLPGQAGRFTNIAVAADANIILQLSNISREDLLRELDQRNRNDELANAPGVEYCCSKEHGGHWRRADGVTFLPAKEGHIRCHCCGITVPNDIINEHTCPSKVTLKRAPEKPREEYDAEDKLREINDKFVEEEIQSKDGTKYLTSTMHSEDHARRRKKIQDELIKVVAENRDLIGAMGELVEDTRRKGRLVPLVFQYLGGEKTQAKINLVSTLLWKLFRGMKNTKAAEGECPYLEPDSENTKLRCLMAAMREDFRWNYNILTDFNFEGGFAARMKDLRATRMNDWPEYATGKNVQDAQVESSEEINITIFDENNDHEFRLKVLVCMGLYFVFRGNKEHASLEKSQIEIGQYEKGHDLEGWMYVKPTNLNDKATKLTFSKGRRRDTKKNVRIPVDPTDQACPGGTIYRYYLTLPPTCKRFYCYSADEKTKSDWARLGNPNVRWNPKRPVGSNKIGVFMKEACTKLGLSCTGHGLRAVGITDVVNGVGNTKETLAFSRHSSLAGQEPYHRATKASEMARLAAQGLDKGRHDRHVFQNPKAPPRCATPQTTASPAAAAASNASSAQAVDGDVSVGNDDGVAKLD